MSLVRTLKEKQFFQLRPSLLVRMRLIVPFNHSFQTVQLDCNLPIAWIDLFFQTSILQDSFLNIRLTFCSKNVLKNSLEHFFHESDNLFIKHFFPTEHVLSLWMKRPSMIRKRSNYFLSLSLFPTLD